MFCDELRLGDISDFMGDARKSRSLSMQTKINDRRFVRSNFFRWMFTKGSFFLFPDCYSDQHLVLDIPLVDGLHEVLSKQMSAAYRIFTFWGRTAYGPQKKEPCSREHGLWPDRVIIWINALGLTYSRTKFVQEWVCLFSKSSLRVQIRWFSANAAFFESRFEINGSFLWPN